MYERGFSTLKNLNSSCISNSFQRSSSTKWWVFCWRELYFQRKPVGHSTTVRKIVTFIFKIHNLKVEVKNKKTFTASFGLHRPLQSSTAGWFEEHCITIKCEKESDADEVNPSERAVKKQKLTNPTVSSASAGPSGVAERSEGLQVEPQHFCVSR